MSTTLNLKNFALAFALSILSVGPGLGADEPTPIISGTVSTSVKKPLAGVQVLLLDQSGAQLASGDTNDRGDFSFKHTVCTRCTLEIMPAPETHYACAIIENIPGDANRNFLLSLQRGFTVSGKVIGAGRGLKGLIVRARSLDPNPDGKKVHDGGFAKTARNGNFSMILTPGHKKIEVSNDRYSEFSRTTEASVDVTSDSQIPDIVLSKPH